MNHKVLIKDQQLIDLLDERIERLRENDVYLNYDDELMIECCKAVLTMSKAEARENLREFFNNGIVRYFHQASEIENKTI